MKRDWIEEQLTIVDYIADKMFGVIKSTDAVLEIGPCHGMFTDRLLNKTTNLTVTDLDESTLSLICIEQPVTSIVADIHQLVQTQMPFDVVVLLAFYTIVIHR